jgi:hypothetical protein
MRRRLVVAALASLGVVALAVAVATRMQMAAPQLRPGEAVTVVFSKGAWVGCLSHPTSEAQVVSLAQEGLVVREVTLNITLVTRQPTGIAQCREVGIVQVGDEPLQFYVPYSVVRQLVRGQDVVWENTGAT